MAYPLSTAKKVIEERICEADFRAYHVGFDGGQYRQAELVDVIADTVPEFVFGPHVTTVEMRDLRARIKEAAKRLYETEHYEKRGEFGEVILHLLLRDYFDAVPLLSKIYFKDSLNSTVHGFDGVQVTVSENEKKLWLGESKLYGNGKEGVRQLANDVIAHTKHDYLRNEFLLISDKIAGTVPLANEWRALLHRHTRLEEILSSVVIPLVCTYTSDVYSQHTKECEEYFDAIEKEVRNLKSAFESSCSDIATNIEVILITFPIKSKEVLVSELHKKVGVWRDA